MSGDDRGDLEKGPDGERPPKKHSGSRIEGSRARWKNGKSNKRDVITLSALLLYSANKGISAPESHYIQHHFLMCGNPIAHMLEN